MDMIMNRRIFFFTFTLLVLTASLLGACLPTGKPSSPLATQPAPAVTPTQIALVDGLGRTVRMEAPAKRVVSLAPSNTEILFALGAGSQVVGRDDFSDYPTEAKKLPSVGGSMSKYDLEAIANLKPDLVLAAGINTPDQVKALENLGLTVYYLPNPSDFNGLFNNILAVARLVGRDQAGEELKASLETRVAKVQAQVARSQERPLVYYELDGSDPTKPWTAGPQSFIDLIIRTAGGRNVGADLSSAWAQISQEELVKADPDFILLGDGAYGVTPESVAKRPGWENLKAVKDGHVMLVDDNLFSRPTPRNVDALEMLAKWLHPDLIQ